MSVSSPKVNIQIIPADLPAGVQAQKVLFVHQKIALGTAIAGDLYEEIGNNTIDNNALFGQSSILAGMVRAFKSINNDVAVLDVIPLDDEGGAVKGTAVFTFPGILTADTIAFLDSDPDTITDSGSGFLTAGYTDGDTITISDSVSNNGVFTIDTVTAGLITLIASDSLVAEPVGATVTIKKTASKLGTDFFNVASTANHRYRIDGLVGDFPEIRATALAAKINADLDAPFTAIASSNVVTITASNGGALSNGWGLGYESGDTGLTCVLTGWTGGATDPDMTGVLDIIDSIRYHRIVIPSSWDIAPFKTLLDSRWNSNNAIMDGYGLQQVNKTYADVKAYAEPINTQNIVVFGKEIKDTSFRKGSVPIEIPDIVMAKVAAILAKRLTQNAPISDLVTTTVPDDQWGGIPIASLPVANTLIPNVAVSKTGEDFLQGELDDFVKSGVAYYGSNRTRTDTIFGNVVTTYRVDNAGNSDASFKFLNTVEEASIAREYFYENLRKQYAQTRLVVGSAPAGFANEAIIRAFIHKLRIDLVDFKILGGGDAAKDDFDNNLIIVIDVVSGTVQYSAVTHLVNQLRVVIGTNKIKFL